MKWQRLSPIRLSTITAPNWQFPGVPPTAKVCQANLEEGDPIEVLGQCDHPDRGYVSGTSGFTYHPQNIPLLQWFEMGTSSECHRWRIQLPR